MKQTTGFFELITSQRNVSLVLQQARTLSVPFQSRWHYSTIFLTDPDEYTGHSFRRSFATHLAESGAPLITLKRAGRWQSDNVDQGYIDTSKRMMIDVSQMLNSNNDTRISSSSSSSTNSNNNGNSVVYSIINHGTMTFYLPNRE